jgi:type IV pilus assembly protein PilW
MNQRQRGFGLIELMLAMAIGLIISAGLVVIFLTQRQVYQSATAQGAMQDADNAIAAILTPAIRDAGFLGCSSMTEGSPNSALGTGSTPLVFANNGGVLGYAASLPASLVDGAPNDLNGSHWQPALDSSLTTSQVGVEQGSDVLVLFGMRPGSHPVDASFAGNNLTLSDASSFSGNGGAPQVIAVSNCASSSLYASSALNGLTLSLASTPNLALYPDGAQAVPLQQAAYYVARGDGGQSALFQAVMTIPAGGGVANATWQTSEIVPGVTAMQVRYGIGSDSNGSQTTQYVSANQVSNWSAVTSLRLGFIVEGGIGSSGNGSATSSYTLFDTFQLPADSRLRHTTFLTVDLRNHSL